ncbi:MAG TPA: hypothetical protein VJO99_05720 [Burkholderiaceae bacterium]|nr:hypothetical protein [Burkholderiaceae bacterium]
MKWKTAYKGYLIASLTTVNEHGRYEARVAIIGSAVDRARSQRFLDLEDYATEAKADDRALEAAKDWIDAHPARENLYAPRTGFTPLI